MDSKILKFGFFQNLQRVITADIIDPTPWQSGPFNLKPAGVETSSDSESLCQCHGVGTLPGTLAQPLSAAGTVTVTMARTGTAQAQLGNHSRA